MPMTSSRYMQHYNICILLCSYFWVMLPTTQVAESQLDTDGGAKGCHYLVLLIPGATRDANSIHTFKNCNPLNRSRYLSGSVPVGHTLAFRLLLRNRGFDLDPFSVDS